MDKVILSLPSGETVDYYSCPALMQGDYCATSLCGEANRRYLMTCFEPSDMVEVYAPDASHQKGGVVYEIENDTAPAIVSVRHAYYTEQYFLKENADVAEKLGGSWHSWETVRSAIKWLEESYPTFDDEYISEVEHDWTDEALDSYGTRDIYSEVSEMVEAAIGEVKSAESDEVVLNFETTIEERLHGLPDEVIKDAYYSTQSETIVEHNLVFIPEAGIKKAAQFLFDQIDPRQYHAPYNPAQTSMFDN